MYGATGGPRYVGNNEEQELMKTLSTYQGELTESLGDKFIVSFHGLKQLQEECVEKQIEITTRMMESYAGYIVTIVK